MELFGLWITATLCLLMISQSMIIKIGNAQSDWIKPDWNYRRKMTISELSGNTLHDYSLTFTLDTATLISQGKMRSDCGDLRIVNENTGEELDWAIDETKNTVTFRVETIEASSINNDLAIYYGNPSATYNSLNYEDVYYNFWTDFTEPIDESFWEEWTGIEHQDPRSPMSIEVSQHETYLDIHTGWARYWRYYLLKNNAEIPVDVGIYVKIRSKIANTPYWSFPKIGIFDQNADIRPEWHETDYLSLAYYTMDNIEGAYFMSLDGTYHPIVGEYKFITSDVYNYHDYELIYDGTKTSVLMDGNHVVDATDYMPNYPSGKATLVLANFHNSAPASEQTTSIDYIYLRNYVDPEPIINLDQEQPYDNDPPDIIINTPTSYGIYPINSGVVFDFSATDNVDPSPVITATVTDFEGNTINVVSGESLPSISGLYTLSVTATDASGNSANEMINFILYDISAGFVTGGGWIIPDAEIGEKANFGFVAKYQKTSTVPNGNLEFQYSYNDLNLKSKTIDWLVVSNVKAIFQGTSTINGIGQYTFRVQATDGDLTGEQPDIFKIMIWEGGDTEGDPIHNYAGDLAGGNIKIHKK